MGRSRTDKPLPIELIDSILRNLARTDLCEASLVSRTFCAEAEPLLYGSVIFTRKLSMFSAFVQTVRANPWKASLVRELSLPQTLYTEPGAYHAPEKLVNYVVDCAKALHNLTHLVFQREEPIPYPPNCGRTEVVLGIFSGSHCRLEVLKIASTQRHRWGPEGWAVLEAQSSIKVFEADDYPITLPHHIPSRTFNILPQLHTASLGSIKWLDHLNGANLRRLSFSHNLNLPFDANFLHRMPLEHLRLYGTVGIDKLPALERILLSVPKLCSVTLALIADARLSRAYTGAVDTRDADADQAFVAQVFALLSRLPKLRELVLLPHNTTAKTFLEVEDVRSAMSATPNLRRVSTAVVTEFLPESEKSAVSDEQVVSYITLLRTESGHIVQEGINIESFESWRTLQ